ncbi:MULTISPECIES: AAA family ATPase [unclassified Synechococcus]|uniref:AAA family ATPase n=1 Tax=unclassified Synechococcus TaxID=2626047 RepID=UPI000B99C9F0|nr:MULTISPECIES: AAA family ATPase [unclassified Synechococcus]MBD2720072.1 AAA family ATPase [Synechococcus sp. FACHB-909]
MNHILYIIGASGSGKTSLALRLSRIAHVIHTDQLALIAAMRLCPFCKPGSAGDWGLWQALLQHTSAIEALHYSFLQSHSICLSFQGPIIIEGTILVWEQWRAALRASLAMAGVDMSRESFLWLDPSPEEIHRNILERARGKEAQLSLGQVQDACLRYSNLVLDQPFAKHSSSSRLEQVIQGLVGAPETGRG